MKEYEMLRAEMMDDYKTISQYNVVLYTATATILAFAIKDGTFLSCLIPYCVLLPLYLICEAKRRGICRIAAYLNVYYEGTEYNWERRHHVFDETVEKNKKKRFLGVRFRHFRTIALRLFVQLLLLLRFLTTASAGICRLSKLLV